jgi:exodeoxyribonuclease-3
MHLPAAAGKHLYCVIHPENRAFSMRIATWNVNSIRQRMDGLQAWLKERQPDIVCLQEIKCTDDAFPREPLEALGYNVAVHGQKTWNGVALLSKLPFDEVAPGLIGDEADVQARFLEALVSTKNGALRVVSLYLPNGNGGDDKYEYKLKWMDRLIRFSGERLKLEEPMLLAGDYNVIPTPLDARRPEVWVNDALFLPPTRERFRTLTNLGLTDAIRVVTDGPGPYTFWDYQAGAFQKDDGIRIDHIMLSPQAADRLNDAGIDRHVRGWEKPSDHVPVYVDLDIETR